MPHVEMRDAFGVMYRITTFGEDLLQEWFDFWLPRTYPDGLPPDAGEPVIGIWPAVDPQTGDADWPAWAPLLNDRFTIPRDPAKALQALRDRRAWMDAEAVKRGYT